MGTAHIPARMQAAHHRQQALAGVLQLQAARVVLELQWAGEMDAQRASEIQRAQVRCTESR